MLTGLRHLLTSPLTGMIAAPTAFALAVGLGVAASGWNAERAEYEARIAELSQATQRAETGLRQELATCLAAGQERPVSEAAYAGSTSGSAGARRLLERGPEGIDACARMESADEAVLSNLKK
jgi:hypothetical protein